MANKKPARRAKKTAKAVKQTKPAKGARAIQAAGESKPAAAAKAAKPPRATKSLVPQYKPEWATDRSGRAFDRMGSIEAGFADLRQRLRMSPAKPGAGRGSRPGQDSDRLDAALKRLGESYRDLFK